MTRTADRKIENGDGHQMPSWREVFLYFLFLGFVNVGGPVAQITMMFNHMVEKRKWLTNDRFGLISLPRLMPTFRRTRSGSDCL
jgi:chromate transport protein ChrA